MRNLLRFILVGFFYSFLYSPLFSQCYSNNCIDAAANTTSVPGCCTATTVGMTTSITANVAGCANFAGGQDVYLTFVAPSSGYLSIDFTAITIAGTVNMVVFDSWSNADNCSTLNAGGVVAACESFSAGAPPNPISLNYVQTGERYFIVVSTPSGSTPGSFQICLSITLPIGGMDCTGSTALCDKSTQVVNSITAGGGSISGNCTMEDISTTTTCGIAGSCWGDGAGDGGGEVNSQWYTFTASSSGTLRMALLPNNSNAPCTMVGGCGGTCMYGDDYDFMLLDITKAASPYYTCNINGSDFGGADSATVVTGGCNWSGLRGVTGFGLGGPEAFGYTGTAQGGCQATDDFSGGVPSATANWNYSDVNVVCGRTYAMVVSNYSGASTQGFTLTWGGTALIGVQPVTMTAPVLTSYCNVTATITAPLCSGSLISSYRYLIDWGDGSTQYATSTNLTHSYADDGTYNVIITVTDPVGCTRGFAQTLTIVCSPLPVGVKNLQVENMGAFNQFTWETYSETNNDYFIIERSQDLATWTLIGKVNGNGNSSEKIKYKFDDDGFRNINNYYRLKQVDYDGQSEYHGPVFIDNSLENQEVEVLKVYDFMGRELSEIPEAGSYILHITYKSGQTVVKKISR